MAYTVSLHTMTLYLTFYGQVKNNLFRLSVSIIEF